MQKRPRRICVIAGCILTALVITLGAVAWWFLSPDRGYTIRGNSVRLIRDDSEVQRLIALEQVHTPKDARALYALLKKPGSEAVTKIRQDPERYFPEHVRFTDAMAGQPSTPVPDGSYARLLEESNALCEADPSLSAKYVKVRVTSGSQRGQEGWLCLWRDLIPTIEIL